MRTTLEINEEVERKEKLEKVNCKFVRGKGVTIIVTLSTVLRTEANIQYNYPHAENDNILMFRTKFIYS